MRRLFWQFLVLLPLPIIVLLVLWVGLWSKIPGASKPILARPSSIDASKGTSLPIATSSGWKAYGPIEHYNAQTLFDRIDGAAPNYIQAGFIQSWGIEYRRNGIKDPIIVDAYDMESPRQALGIYASERDLSYQFINIGEEGYLASGSLNFWHGRFYIKLAGYEEGEVMDRELTALAKALAAALPRDPETPKVLAMNAKLPTEGRKAHSFAYSRAPLHEVDGLSGAFYADYQVDENNYQLFYIPETSSTARDTRWAKAKASFARLPGAKQEKTFGTTTIFENAGDDGKSAVLIRGSEGLFGALELPDINLVPLIKTQLQQIVK